VSIDWTGGQIHNDDCSDDVKNVDLSQVHYLTGPIAVDTAEPGDLLKVEILQLGPLEGDEWGFTGTFHKENGGGFLTDHYPQVILPARRRLVTPVRPQARLSTPGSCAAGHQGVLGFRRHLLLLAAHPRRALRRAHPPGPHRHRAIAGAPPPAARIPGNQQARLQCAHGAAARALPRDPFQAPAPGASRHVERSRARAGWCPRPLAALPARSAQRRTSSLARVCAKALTVS
jgi:hypothetical protein